MLTDAHKMLYQARPLLPMRNDLHKVSAQPRTRTNFRPPLPPPPRAQAWDLGGSMRREGLIGGGFIGSRLSSLLVLLVLLLDIQEDLGRTLTPRRVRARQARILRSTPTILRRGLCPLRRATNSRATPTTTPTLWYLSSLWVYNLSAR